MIRIYPKIKHRVNSVFLYIQKVGNGKHEHIIVKKGETVIIEGGPSTGKTEFLKKAIRKLTAEGERCFYFNAMLPLGDWLKEYRLFGKNLEARIEYFLKTLPESFYLMIDNAERITDSKKLEFVMILLEKARSSIIACSSFSHLVAKLKVRLKDAKIHSLGGGADTFDITYIVVALMIVIVALIGAHSLIFLAAAMRYMFQGTRIGGKRI